jgi:hypothetical protein
LERLRKYETGAFLNDEGKKIWGKIFPDGQVPIRSIISQGAYIEGLNQTERVFLVDWPELTAEQQDAILTKLSEKSRAAKDVILKDIQKIGLPLREKYTNGCGTTRVGLFI